MALKVPISFTSSGITFVVVPPLIEVIERTEGSNGFLLRLITCCRLITRCDAISIGSIVVCGEAACPPFPFIVKYSSSALAITLPLRKLSLPVSSWGLTWQCRWPFLLYQRCSIRLFPE